MKRSGYIQRKTPLRRAPWRRKVKGKAYRSMNSYRLRPRYLDYMLWVKTLPCIVGWLPMVATGNRKPAHAYAHEGDVEADHAGPRALGRKAHDSTCIPICRNHHDQRTNGWGLFWGYTLEEKRAWKADAIIATQARARELGITVPEIT